MHAGAFDDLAPNRRLALWDAGLAMRPLRNGQAALALPVGDAHDLDDVGAFERMMGEYRVMGVYPRGHVMKFVRPYLDGGVLPTAPSRATTARPTSSPPMLRPSPRACRCRPPTTGAGGPLLHSCDNASRRGMRCAGGKA